MADLRSARLPTRRDSGASSSTAGSMLRSDHMRAGTREPVNAPDSRYSWLRLAICTLISTIGGVGMWSFVVMLPAIQADFGITRGEASLPYTVLMVGFALGSIVTGRLADRFGIRLTLVFGSLAAGLGFVLGGLTSSALAAHHRLWVARARYVRRFRSTDRGRLPLVRALARNCGRHLLGRQLSLRCGMAAGDQPFHRLRGLARNPHRHRSVLPGHGGAARVAAGPAHGAGARHRRHLAACRQLGSVTDGLAGAALDRRRRLLCRHVDAAGAYRRLLRRSRLRRGPRRRDVVADDGVRHREPDRNWLSSPIGSGGCGRCCSARCCKASRSCSTRCSTG